uniref:Uncharacterized protein n=1 Tax=Oryza glumipatula TaxID=40148 RepID=A0A0D9YNU6_9ORYZ
MEGSDLTAASARSSHRLQYVRSGGESPTAVVLEAARLSSVPFGRRRGKAARLGMGKAPAWTGTTVRLGGAAHQALDLTVCHGVTPFSDELLDVGSYLLTAELLVEATCSRAQPQPAQPRGVQQLEWALQPRRGERSTPAMVELAIEEGLQSPPRS